MKDTPDTRSAPQLGVEKMKAIEALLYELDNEAKNPDPVGKTYRLGVIMQNYELTVRQALSAPPVDGWQNISTAPPKALIFVPGTGAGMIYVGWKSGDKWIVFDTGRGESASVTPTHWMPLPAPPEATAMMEE